MGLFDFLKKHGFSKDSRISGLIDNEDYQRKRQIEIDWLEKKYDLSTVEGINAIPVPTRKSAYNGISVTGKIEYYLIMKAGEYERADKVELALACYRKANELMPMSSTAYPYETYMRLPGYLRKLRRFDEARVEEAKIESLFRSGCCVIGDRSQVEQKQLELHQNLHQFKTDLVEASYIRCCCAECAKYRERVYSVSGKDKRFPVLPDYLLSGEHDCGIQLFPFIYDVNSMRTRDGRDLRGMQIVKYSNRPFIDDRTPDELQDIMEIQRQLAINAAREKARADYDWLLEFLPEICPKSFSGYMRMKNSNSKNYQKIVVEASKLGRNIR